MPAFVSHRVRLVRVKYDLNGSQSFPAVAAFLIAEPITEVGARVQHDGSRMLAGFAHNNACSFSAVSTSCERSCLVGYGEEPSRAI